MVSQPDRVAVPPGRGDRLPQGLEGRPSRNSRSRWWSSPRPPSAEGRCPGRSGAGPPEPLPTSQTPHAGPPYAVVTRPGRPSRPPGRWQPTLHQAANVIEVRAGSETRPHPLSSPMFIRPHASDGSPGPRMLQLQDLVGQAGPGHVPPACPRPRWSPRPARTCPPASRTLSHPAAHPGPSRHDDREHSSAVDRTADRNSTSAAGRHEFSGGPWCRWRRTTSASRTISRCWSPTRQPRLPGGDRLPRRRLADRSPRLHGQALGQQPGEDRRHVLDNQDRHRQAGRQPLGPCVRPLARMPPSQDRIGWSGRRPQRGRRRPRRRPRSVRRILVIPASLFNRGHLDRRTDFQSVLPRGGPSPAWGRSRRRPSVSSFSRITSRVNGFMTYSSAPPPGPWPPGAISVSVVTIIRRMAACRPSPRTAWTNSRPFISGMFQSTMARVGCTADRGGPGPRGHWPPLSFLEAGRPENAFQDGPHGPGIVDHQCTHGWFPLLCSNPPST